MPKSDHSLGGAILWQRIEGGAMGVAAIGGYAGLNYSWWTFILTVMLPDISLIAYVWGPKYGALVYNVVHSYVGPLLIFGLSLLFDLSTFFQAVAFIWLAHNGIDRAFGYGLKYSDNFKHTHLGWLPDSSRIEKLKKNIDSRAA